MRLDLSDGQIFEAMRRQWYFFETMRFRRFLDTRYYRHWCNDLDLTIVNCFCNAIVLTLFGWFSWNSKVLSWFLKFLMVSGFFQEYEHYTGKNTSADAQIIQFFKSGKKSFFNNAKSHFWTGHLMVWAGFLIWNYHHLTQLNKWHCLSVPWSVCQSQLTTNSLGSIKEVP